MKSYSIKELLQTLPSKQEIEVNGWVRTFRSNRFIALNDGSTINNIQCVVDFEQFNQDVLKKITTGAALKIKGILVESLGKGQNVEIQANEIFVHGDADPDSYPIQPKKHSMEFLREQAHLRIRTNTFAAVMRVRSALAFAIPRELILLYAFGNEGHHAQTMGNEFVVERAGVCVHVDHVYRHSRDLSNHNSP